MKKYLEGEFGGSIISGDFQTKSDECIDITSGRIQSYSKVFYFASLKLFYVLVIVSGMAGVIISIFKTIFLTSISNFDMVFIFGIACISIGAICAGVSGLHKMKIESRGQKLNLTKTNFIN
jgi:hypothetical protein